MSNVTEIELILNRQKYPIIYNITFLISLILIIFIYILFTYHYQSYYLIQGKITDNKLEISIPIDDIKYIKNNHILFIDKKSYYYKLHSISSDVYINDDYKNYQIIYLDIESLNSIDNYIYEIKIPKENKILAKYLKDYL